GTNRPERMLASLKADTGTNIPARQVAINPAKPPSIHKFLRRRWRSYRSANEPPSPGVRDGLGIGDEMLGGPAGTTPAAKGGVATASEDSGTRYCLADSSFSPSASTALRKAAARSTAEEYRSARSLASALSNTRSTFGVTCGLTREGSG